MYSRRHLLRKSSLEIMTTAPRQGYLFNFPGGSDKVKEFFLRLMATKPHQLFHTTTTIDEDRDGSSTGGGGGGGGSGGKCQFIL